MMEEQGLTQEELMQKMRKPKSAEKKFQVYRMDKKGRTLEGIEALFMEYDIIKSKYDPNEIVENTIQSLGLVEE